MNVIVANALWIITLVAVVTFILFSGIMVSNGKGIYTCRLQESAEFFRSNQKQADIILSLTTMPERLKSANFRKVLESFFFQTVKPKEIRLNIPYTLKRTGQAYEVPAVLSGLPITIERCEDEGPATKYLTTLRRIVDPKQRIAIYDDDSFMPVNWIEKMDILTQSDPRTCFTTVGYKAAELFKANPRDFENVYGKISQERQLMFDLARQRYRQAISAEDIDIVTGWSGYVIRPNMVDVAALSDFDTMPKDAFFVDDIVMSGCLAKKQTPVKIALGVEHSKFTHPDLFYTLMGAIGATAKEALSLTDNREYGHDKVMADWFGFKR